MTLTTESLKIMNDRVVQIIKSAVPRDKEQKDIQAKIIETALQEEKKIATKYQAFFMKAEEHIRNKLRKTFPDIKDAEIEVAITEIFTNYLNEKGGIENG